MSLASRPPPPQIAAVEIDGVSYAQVLNARKLGLPEKCGYLAAMDVDTGQRLWIQQIYSVKTDPDDESDVQERYFSRLERLPGSRALLIEDESGLRFQFDIDSKQVTALP
ncbi:hypothetical protein [Nevskia sp.]|uniref:hypothetical protein n=1 Tax=Nevskia sp. TaxID=1929292 RepID=UPI0025D2041A|nr:hypothetical protein [Nevskia sp.]